MSFSAAALKRYLCICPMCQSCQLHALYLRGYMWLYGNVLLKCSSEVTGTIRRHNIAISSLNVFNIIFVWLPGRSNRKFCFILIQVELVFMRPCMHPRSQESQRWIVSWLTHGQFSASNNAIAAMMHAWLSATQAWIVLQQQYEVLGQILCTYVSYHVLDWYRWWTQMDLLQSLVRLKSRSQLLDDAPSIPTPL